MLKGQVVRLPEGRKVPHMGWNRVEQRRETPLFDGIPDGSHFYFVHSYYCDMADPDDVVAIADYWRRCDGGRRARVPHSDAVPP